MELHSNFALEGDVLTGGPGNVDTFALGGAVDQSFDVSKFVTSATTNDGNTEFQGFDIFEKVGTSKWTLTNTTSELTPWTVYEGVLSTSANGALGDISGDLTIDGGTWQVTGNSFTTTTRDIVLGDTNGRPNGIDIDSSSNVFEYNQAIIGSGGLQKLGLGTLELNAVNTYTGQTDVIAGKLVIGDSIANGAARVQGDVLVYNGAILAGHGNLGGDLINNGTVTPGNSFGTLHVDGDYYAGEDGGTLAIELDGQSGHGVIHDQLEVGETAYLEDTTLKLVKNSFELNCGDNALVIDAGNYNGQVDLFDISGFENLMLFDNGTGIVYGTGVGQDEDLSDIHGLNDNQEEIAGALSEAVLNDDNFIDHTKPLDAAVIEILRDCDKAGDVIDQLSPEGYAGFVDYGIQVTRNYTRTAMNMPGIPPQADAPAPITEKGAKDGMTAAPVAVSRNTQVFGGFSHFDTETSSSDNGADYDINSNGGILGARHTMGAFSFGGFVGYDEGEVTSNLVDADVDGLVVGAFTRYQVEKTHNITIDGGVTYGDYDFDGQRSTMFGTADFDGGDTSVWDIFASLQGDVYKTDKFRLTPSLGLHYLVADTDSIEESGIGPALGVDSMDEDALLAELDLKFEYKVNSKFVAYGSVGYTHNFLDSEREVDAVFLGGGSPFSVVAPGLGDNIFSASIGGVWYINEALSLGAGYRAEFSDDSDMSNSVGIGASYGF